MKSIVKFTYEAIKSLFIDSFRFLKTIVTVSVEVIDFVFFKNTKQLKEEFESRRVDKFFLDSDSEQFHKNFKKNIEILQDGKKGVD